MLIMRFVRLELLSVRTTILRTKIVFRQTRPSTRRKRTRPFVSTLNPATTVSVGNYEVVEAGGVSELGSNHIEAYQYGHRDDGQHDLSPGPDMLPAMLPAQRAYPTPPSESPPCNPPTSHPSYDAPPPTELFAPFPWGDGNPSRPDQGNGMPTAEATRARQATTRTRTRRTATSVRPASSSEAFEMCEPGPPYPPRQCEAYAPSAPTAPTFAASGLDAQTIGMPEFVQGSSSGAPAANAPRSSKAGPSRTQKRRRPLARARRRTQRRPFV
ncbi:hypothetical protein DFH11DRAFT_1167199 [Phellopilus nigrolimitatus]|nr:hypothetical protein DFH11DRAFT_1167199 [Phellopilus nigrolimitatus]